MKIDRNFYNIVGWSALILLCIQYAPFFFMSFLFLYVVSIIVNFLISKFSKKILFDFYFINSLFMFLIIFYFILMTIYGKELALLTFALFPAMILWIRKSNSGRWLYIKENNNN